MIYQYVAKLFPMVKQTLNHWQRLAAQIPDTRLSKQATESIRSKAFHCLGGSIYALYPGADLEATIQFIVAYQTMSDYLDNLVDSLEIQDEKAFSQLHLAMQEALDPQVIPSDYYEYYPYREDGGYLESLVHTCQQSLKRLPSYYIVREQALELAKLYACLQTYKHLSIEERELKMLTWIQPNLASDSEITVWEFAAATGSTLGIFCLFVIAYEPQLSVIQVRKIKQAYFPWICGLHILMDYFIDLREDRETNQLNFVAYYGCTQVIRERLQLFVRNSLAQAQKLNNPKFHRMVVQGLLAMYLSDKKSRDADIRPITKVLLRDSGWGVNWLYWLCRLLRKGKVL